MKNLRQELIRQKYWQVWNRTQSDPEYARMFAQMAELEQRFESVMEQLPDDTQDVIRDFVMHCEGMSRRMLECACEELLFPDLFPQGGVMTPPTRCVACRGRSRSTGFRLPRHCEGEARGNPFSFSHLRIGRKTDCHVASLLAMTVVDVTCTL